MNNLAALKNVFKDKTVLGVNRNIDQEIGFINQANNQLEVIKKEFGIDLTNFNTKFSQFSYVKLFKEDATHIKLGIVLDTPGDYTEGNISTLIYVIFNYVYKR